MVYSNGYNNFDPNQWNNQQYSNQNSNVAPVTFQQPPQRDNPTYIRGRVVNSERDIAPEEIPMDGTYAIFVQDDQRAVYAKTLGSNGRVDTKYFIRLDDPQIQQPQQPQQAPQNDPLASILKRLDDLEDALTRPTTVQNTPINEEVTNNA